MWKVWVFPFAYGLPRQPDTKGVDLSLVQLLTEEECFVVLPSWDFAPMRPCGPNGVTEIFMAVHL